MSGPLPLHDVACVVHVHSVHSDGTGTVAEIARAASHSGVDVVLLTDHDTMRARDTGEEGWHDSVLVLVGEEVSPLQENHYLAFGLEQPISHRGLSAQEIVDRVNEAGGFGFLSHPFSQGSPRFKRARAMAWSDMEARGYAGLELWSFVTDSAERIESFRDVLRLIVTPGRFVDHPPRRNLEAWDRICASRRCAALGGLDAHQVGIRVAGRVPLRLMAYKRSFRFLRTHLLLERPLSGELEPDQAAVYSALAAGRAYIAMDSIAAARGFDFWCDGAGRLSMGEEAPVNAGMVLRAHLPRRARVRLLRDGSEVAAVSDGDRLEYAVDAPGAYRVEAYVSHLGRERTWILSNPVYLR